MYHTEHLNKEMSRTQIFKIFEEYGYYVPLNLVKPFVNHREYAEAIKMARENCIDSLRDHINRRVSQLKDYFEDQNAHIKRYGVLRPTMKVIYGI